MILDTNARLLCLYIKTINIGMLKFLDRVQKGDLDGIIYLP